MVDYWIQTICTEEILKRRAGGQEQGVWLKDRKTACGHGVFLDVRLVADVVELSDYFLLFGRSVRKVGLSSTE